MSTSTSAGPGTSSSISPQPIITLPSTSITIRTYLPTDTPSITPHANNRKIWLNQSDNYPFPYTAADADWWYTFTTDRTHWLPVVHSCSQRLPSESDAAFSIRQEKSSKVPDKYVICHANLAVGSIGLQYDASYARTVGLEYWIGEEYWGKGIMTEVVRGFVEWVFGTFEWVVRVEAGTMGWNVGSQRVLVKAGFVMEGRQRGKVWKDGRVGDRVLFGLVREGVAGEV